MTEGDYRRLTAECDKLLRSTASTPDRVAISWLHILNEHPSNLSRYEELFHTPHGFVVSRRKLRDAAGIAKTLIRTIRRPCGDLLAAPVEFPSQVDVLFISHLVSAHATPDAPDFYYGTLPDQLAARGVTSLIALQNHVLHHGDILRQRMVRGGTTSRIVLPGHATVSQEAGMIQRARRCASTLLREAADYHDPFARNVALQAARHAVTSSTIACMRFHTAVRRLCARFRPRAIMVLWEGHAWERLAFHAARMENSRILRIGYQHTILFPRAHALKRALGGSYDADAILTVGDANRDILRAVEDFRDTKIETYGSHRRAGAVERRARDAGTRCLVIPEGIESECLTLFSFTLKAAALLPQVRFVLRTHPVLPYGELARRHAYLRALPPNVIASDQAEITADFVRCDWALYRGSSAAVHAILAGVRPIYVERPGELRIDPLFALTSWRRHVSDPEALKALIGEDQRTRAADRAAEWEPARGFCERYMASPNPDLVLKCLSSHLL